MPPCCNFIFKFGGKKKNLIVFCFYVFSPTIKLFNAVSVIAFRKYIK